MGKLALRAGVAEPMAEALAAWGAKHRELASSERLLLGNLYYVAGRNAEALRVFKTVEPELAPGSRHRWLLIAMLTAHLRTGRPEEAESTRDRLIAAYPDTAEIDEAKYRFGVHYFHKRRLDEAETCFEQLLASSRSRTFKTMCTQYLERIWHLKSTQEGDN